MNYKRFYINLLKNLAVDFYWIYLLSLVITMNYKRFYIILLKNLLLTFMSLFVTWNRQERGL